MFCDDVSYLMVTKQMFMLIFTSEQEEDQEYPTSWLICPNDLIIILQFGTLHVLLYFPCQYSKIC